VRGEHTLPSTSPRPASSHIGAWYFYKRPGKWCRYSDYLPVCLGDQQEVDETVAEVPPRSLVLNEAIA
jgi:hypothetical protein